jgi:4-hydroxybenzoate polyprenyltransferase
MKASTNLPEYQNAVSADVKRRGVLRLIWISMRPRQWVKNLFVLAPLLFGQRLDEPVAVGQALLAGFSFCLIASALYIVNDFADSAADARHEEKRKRPIASGALPVRLGLSASVLLAIIGLIGSALLGWRFLMLTIVYSLLMLAYSYGLKRVTILESMIIATGFLVRVIGGAVAISVTPSHWIIVCSFLLALYLAFSKRRQEMLVLSGEALQHRNVLGHYSVAYLEQVSSILIGAIIVCYALYTVSPETVERFQTNQLIWGTGFVIYGLFRYLALIQDHLRGGDPTKVLLSDKPLLLATVGWALYNISVIYYDRIRYALSWPFN